MHVLFPIGSLYPSQAGGPSNTIYWLGKALHQQQVQVTIVTTNIDIPPSMCDQWLDTDYGKVRYCTARSRFLPGRLIWHSILQLRKADVVHMTALFTAFSTIIALFAILMRKKIVWSVRGELSEIAIQQKKAGLKKIMLANLKLLKRFIHFHVTSEEELILTRKVFGEKNPIIFIPNHIELPQKVTLPTQNYLLYLGRVHPIKAIENMLDAVSLSKNFKKDNFRLKIVGKIEENPDYVQYLKNKIDTLQLSERVEWLGRLTGDPKEQCIGAAKCLILPSHSENFGNVVVEALAQATPVIASSGTPWQILESTKSGFWTDNAPQSIANAIDKMLELSPDDYQKYRQNAFLLVKEKYDVFTNVHHWTNTYQAVVNA
ncbi:MAG: putative glycosyltransferase [Bacteroidota bacterium]|jgi:glycosyltransferase involved in cell wall biosynthesis